ncbi:MAG: diguanylate cyclase [Burkholderiales bacterium]|nr:diguanylate cyclase [Burkholderiales bacterium]
MSRRFLVLFGVVAVLGSVLAWFLSSALLQDRIAALMAGEERKIRQDVSNISENLERILNRLQGLPAVLAIGSDVAAVLAAFGPDVKSSPLALDARKAAWTRHPDLLALNRQLMAAAREMDVDVIWVMNASGDCVAASNFTERTSFVGTNYVDRSYFKSAQAGNRGHQYAMGRVTNVPGLFFSAPVMAGTRFLGAVAIKIDLPRLAPWVNHPHAFVTDENGVVILAGDRGLEMRALPGSAVFQWSAEQRLARYKRSEFELLGIEAGRSSGGLARVTGSPHPHLVAHNELAQYGVVVHMLVPIKDIESMRGDAFIAFLLLSFSGVMLIALVFGARIYVLRARQHRQSIEATNASLNELNEHLNRIARTDSLTDCANRRHFQACLETELVRAGRYGRECSLLLIDIDFFKQINDRHGHATGDEALRHFVQIVRQQLRSQDELGRLGGEEFAVLLPETGLANAIAAAERIRCAVEAAPLRFGGVQIPLTASFGVACWKSPAESADALLQRADTALYAAKSGGRNRVASADGAADQLPRSLSQTA